MTGRVYQGIVKSDGPSDTLLSEYRTMENDYFPSDWQQKCHKEHHWYDVSAISQALLPANIPVPHMECKTLLESHALRHDEVSGGYHGPLQYRVSLLTMDLSHKLDFPLVWSK